MKISIITVCFNSGLTIADCIKSVISQNYIDIEFIVVDGMSTDSTNIIINSFRSNISKYVSEPDLGIYDAMNKGISLSTGDVIGFLNSDDVFDNPNVIADIASEFQNGVDVVYGDLVLVEKGDLTKIIRYWRPGEYAPGACLKGWMPPHPTLYVRRSILLSVGCFNLQYKLQSDVDLIFRLFEIFKVKTKYVGSIFVRQRFGGATTGSLKNILKGNYEAALSYRRNGFGFPFLFIICKIFNRIPQYFKIPIK